MDLGRLASSSGGEFRRHSLTGTPMVAQLGDKWQQIGNTVFLIRDNTIVDSRAISPEFAVVPWTGVEQPGPIDSVIYFWSKRMAVVTITNVTLDPSGTVYVDFSSGNQREMTLATLESGADALDANVSLAEEILMAKLIRAQPTLDNADALNGSTVSIDTAGAAPIIYSEAN